MPGRVLSSSTPLRLPRRTMPACCDAASSHAAAQILLTTPAPTGLAISGLCHLQLNRIAAPDVTLTNSSHDTRISPLQGTGVESSCN